MARALVLSLGLHLRQHYLVEVWQMVSDVNLYGAVWSSGRRLQDGGDQRAIEQ